MYGRVKLMGTMYHTFTAFPSCIPGLNPDNCLTTLTASASSNGWTPLRTIDPFRIAFSVDNESDYNFALNCISFCSFGIFCILCNEFKKCTFTTRIHRHLLNHNKWRFFNYLIGEFKSYSNIRMIWIIYFGDSSDDPILGEVLITLITSFAQKRIAINCRT